MTAHDLPAAAAGDPEALETVDTALKTEQTQPLASAAGALDPATAGDLILRLKPKRARRLLGLLPDDLALQVLKELDAAVGEGLLDETQQRRFLRILAKLPAPEAADFLADAPLSLGDSVREAPPEALAAVSGGLSHAADSVGARMSRSFLVAPMDWTLGQVLDEMRQSADAETALGDLYVVDQQQRLRGLLRLEELLLRPSSKPVSQALVPAPAVVTAETDRAEAAALADEARLSELPVVDDEGRLIGRLAAEDLRAIDRAEADEDLKLSGRVAPASTQIDGPLRILPRRLPWLAAGLIGSGTAAMVVGSYEEALTEAAILATLIPIVMSLAGNAGIQASTVTVQAQTAGTFWIGDLGGRLLREIGGAVLNGLIVGLLVGCAILGFSTITEIDRPWALAATALLTLVVVTTQAAAIGSMVPVLLDRLGFDPAVATGVFITTSNDVIGVLVYFLVATTLYL
jgi:magnesium transporter